jgi:hypothetical protein
MVFGRLFQAGLDGTGAAGFRRFGRSGLAARASWGAGAVSVIEISTNTKRREITHYLSHSGNRRDTSRLMPMVDSEIIKFRNA